MATVTSKLRAAAIAIVLLAAGCYRPSIEDGGFLCNTEGKACPDGFSCVQGHCTHGTASDVDSGTCKFPPPTPLCNGVVLSGEACNPACQVGCACGRCNVDHGKATCTDPGSKTLGQKCDPNNDDCAAGLICLGEMCGNRLGRCYQHCSDSTQCKSGSLCQIPVLDAQNNDTGYKVCDLASETCDPINDTGCPDPALHCYLTSGDQTLCDCSNRSQMLNQDCALYNDCAAGMGLVCVNVNGVSRCFAACEQAMPFCGGAACVPTGTKYGYCQSSL